MSWVDIKVSYQNSKRKINNYIHKKSIIEEKGNDDHVELQISREIKRDLIETENMIDQKILYEFKAFSIQDIENSKLKETEMKIIEYRIKNKYTFKKISELLSMSQSSVFEAFKNGKKKIEKYKKLNSSKEKNKNRLSNQEKNIYKLMEEGKTNNQIASELNITPGNVRKQRSKINKKLGVTKNPNK